MAEDFRAKIEEISLLAVMASADDAQGLDLIFESAGQLAGQADCPAPVKAAIGELLKAKARADRYDLLNRFIDEVNQFIEQGKDMKFALDAEPAAAAKPAIDRILLVEFGESHFPAITELESQLMSEGNDEGVISHLKRYLHTLKGDAGAIGASDIERVCHVLEDRLQSQPFSASMGELFLFTEWFRQTLNELLEDKPLSCHGETFLKGLGVIQCGAKESTSTVSAEVTIFAAPPPAAAAEHEIERSQMPPAYTLTGEADLLIDFIVEAEEHLSAVEQSVVDRRDALDKSDVDVLFRAVHSLKGGSAYFGLIETSSVSHILENLLHEVRDGKRSFDSFLIDSLVRYVDLQKDVFKRARDCSSRNAAMSTSETCKSFLRDLEDYSAGRTVAPAAAPVPADTADAISPGAETASAPSPVERAPKAANNQNSGDMRSFVKVDTARLDHLIDSVGEMVIYSSMLIRQCRELLHDNRTVLDLSHRVERFSRDLQDVGMSMRLVPIKGLFQKMARLVWDTAKRLGKDVDFQLEGEDTELDRNLIDKLADPLMHMVRNAVDHGLEFPDERAATKKDRKGKILLSASHEGGSIRIRIKDDGKGICIPRIVQKAEEKGLIEKGKKLSEQEAYQLLFAPGFSTAAKVTDISGRGVGMDVVRKNVESLRGRIHVESVEGEGSCFIIEIPLTLAIIDGIEVVVGQEHFILPSLSIVEFIRPKDDLIHYAFDKGETLSFRGEYLPVYRLGKIFEVENYKENLRDGTILVVEFAGQRVGLVVDEVLGQYATVIKNLGPLFRESRGLAGCAIMPRGDVALIIDVRSLIELAFDSYAYETPSQQPAVMQQ